MPRKGRVILPHTPHHIVQRGHNRNAVFIEEQDYQYYLDNLQEWKHNLGLKVYSFCLMTNHIHLIVEPDAYSTDVGELMKRLAGRQTRFANKMEGRSGSLWSSRYKISPIETDEYLLQCCRYVELNPVKAGMVADPIDYPWSSYRNKLGDLEENWIDVDECFKSLGNSNEVRRQRYREFVLDKVSASKEQKFIGDAAERNQLTGSKRFIDEVEARTGIRIEQRAQGRPARTLR